jgi:flagellar capping protein FliD
MGINRINLSGEASMARLKRSSTGLEQAIRRLAGMRSISETLEFGDGLGLAEYDARIQALQTQLSSYNTMLSGLDEMTGQIALMEQELRSYSEKMLMSVAARYGKDSLQYVQAGGKQRKASKRSPVNATPTTKLAATVETVIAPSAEKAKTNGKGTKATVH